MSMRDLLLRGMLAGLIAAVLAFGFARVVGEPQVNAAISFEESHAEPLAPGEHEHEEVTRDVQSSVGLATGLVLLSVAFGGLFSIAYAVAYGRIGAIGARGTALLVSMLGFGAIYVVPFLKYPANPPATGDPDTIGKRTALYFGVMLVSLALTVGGVVVWRRLSSNLGAWNAAIVTGAAVLVVVIALYVLMPTVNEVPDDFPATTLWKFRVASLGLQFVIWGSLGVAFGWLTERALQREAQPMRYAAASPSRS